MSATSSDAVKSVLQTLTPSERLVADAPELDAPAHEHDHADPAAFTLPERLTVLTAILLPFLATIAAVVLLWGGMVNGWYLALTGVFYAITVLGVTIGYHRMITHKSFDAGGFIRLQGLRLKARAKAQGGPT
jgi:fatty-acid desaturase